MWGKNWGQMIWGGVRAVPAMPVWAIALLCGAFVLLGVRFVRARRPLIGLAAFALALAVPLTAKAVTLPFTFANNTVADATQVNANFTAVSNAIPNTYLIESFQNLVMGQTVTLTAQCNLGDVVIGGFTRAFGVSNLSGDQRVAAIAPIGPAPAMQGWTATATGATSAPDFLDVFAECIHVPQQ